MPRYAVLHALDGDGLPVGLVIERRGYVLVEALDEFGLPKRIDEEYRVLERDLSELVYSPGEDGYFDQVLVELARRVAVGEQGLVDDADWGTILDLLSTKVTNPRLSAIRRQYAASSGFDYGHTCPIYDAQGERLVRTSFIPLRPSRPDGGEEARPSARPSRRAHRVAA